MEAGSRTLRLATLERLGSAEKIVRMHLDQVMDRLDAARQEVCAKFFDRLVTPSGTKIACSLSDLTVFAGPSSSAVAPILETLCASRVLRGVAIPGATRPSDTNYEIYHDVIAPAILDWRRGYLQAQQRAEADRQAAEQAQAQAKATYANRLRNLYAALSVLAVCAIVFLGLWVYQKEQQRAALDRQNHARELAAAAQNMLEAKPELGTLLAIDAVRVTSSADGSMTDTAADVLQHIIHAPHAKQLLGLPGMPRTMFFTPDGTRFVATTWGPSSMIPGTASGSRVPAWRPTTMIWDTASGSSVSTMVAERPVTAPRDIGPDGQRFATASPEGVVRVLEAESGKEIFSVAHSKVVTAAVFSPDGQRLASASGDGTLKVSDTTGQDLFPPVGQSNKVAVLAYSPDSKWLAVASQDKTVKVLDADSGSQIFSEPVPGQAVATALTFNADGKLLAARTSSNADNVTVWEVSSGKSSTLSGLYNTVAFSPDGKFFAGAGQDGLVHLWIVPDHGNVRLWRTLFGHVKTGCVCRFQSRLIENCFGECRWQRPGLANRERQGDSFPEGRRGLS
jgi:hypothetical protein